MVYKTLISIEDLLANIENPNWAVFDCHFDFEDGNAARQAYLDSHISGALYADLEKDLSGPILPGKTGRHPLPEVEVFGDTLSRWGIDEHVQVVVYDNRGSSLAARLWWMLRWLGHEAVAVLDGSYSHWQAAGLPLSTGGESRSPRAFTPQPNPGLMRTAGQIVAADSGDILLIDSRAAERYRGEVEPLDPVAGHIPGSINAHYLENLDQDQHFKSAADLRARFEELLGGTPAEQAVFYCGSGVTAVHNIIALELAGLGQARLYPGSWSDWITDPNRPIAASE